MKAKLPWTISEMTSYRKEIRDADDRVILCDIPYYPSLNLSDSDLKELVEIVNMYGKAKHEPNSI